MTRWEESRIAREAKIEALHEQLTDAVGQLVSGADWARAIEFAARFRTRSFNNTLLIWMQHMATFESGRVPEPVPSYVAGFKQWLSLGRSVLKGQAGYMIQAPVTARFATATPLNPESWRRLERNEKSRPGEIARSKLVGVRPAYVWDVTQTAGDPIPEQPSPRLLEGEAPAGLWDGLAQLIQAHGFAVRPVAHAGLIRGANGLTDYAARTVAVRQDMDDAAQVKTLAHELAHVILHGPDNPDTVHHRGIGEVEAESLALMIGAAHGLDTTSYTIPYVSSWATSVEGRSAVEVVEATGERVRATAVKILDALPTVQIGGGDPPGLTREANGRATERMSAEAAKPEVIGPQTRTAELVGRTL